MRKLTTKEWIYLAFASLALLLLAISLGIPLGNSQFWIVLASWVQAVGSIGAIAAAIWIGQKQHDQNVALVTDERQRIADEQKEAAKSLREATAALLDPFRDSATALIAALRPFDGSIEPMPPEVVELIGDVERFAKSTKADIAELRDVFVGQPSTLVVHGHLVRLVGLLERHCKIEKGLEANRQTYAQIVAYARATGAHGQEVQPRAVRVADYQEVLELLEDAFSAL